MLKWGKWKILLSSDVKVCHFKFPTPKYLAKVVLWLINSSKVAWEYVRALKYTHKCAKHNVKYLQLYYVIQLHARQNGKSHSNLGPKYSQQCNQIIWKCHRWQCIFNNAQNPKENRTLQHAIQIVVIKPNNNSVPNFGKMNQCCTATNQFSTQLIFNNYGASNTFDKLQYLLMVMVDGAK